MSKAAKKKNTHGGARRKPNPVKGKSRQRAVMLYDYENDDITAYYGSLTKALRDAMDQIPEEERVNYNRIKDQL